MGRSYIAVRIAGGIALALLLGASASAVGSRASEPVVRYVSATDPTCGGCAPCYSNLQLAVSEAAPGDEIHVSEGAYSGVQTIEAGGIDYTQVVLIDKPLRLLGGYSSTDWDVRDPQGYPSIIDAEYGGRGITVLGSEGDSVEVSGFTIVHGDYTGLGNPPNVANRACGRTSSDCGGGIYARGVRLSLAELNLVDNVASRNETYSDGGGAYLWNLAPGSAISSTLFYSNSAGSAFGSGGGAVLRGGASIVIEGCTFSQNVAGEGAGALLVFQPSGTVTVTRSSFMANDSGADEGGAIWASLAARGDALVIDRSVFEHNASGTRSAAIHAEKAGPDDSRVRIVNSLFTQNRAANAQSAVIELENDCSAEGGDLDLQVAHVTAVVVGTDAFLRVSATGGASARAVLTNTLIAHAQIAYIGEQADPSLAEIRHSHTLTWLVGDLHTTQSGSPVFEAIAPIVGDPMLEFDGRLLPGSAAINAGVDAGALEDIEGRRRPVGPPDVGAFEFAEMLYLPIAIRSVQ